MRRIVFVNIFSLRRILRRHLHRFCIGRKKALLRTLISKSFINFFQNQKLIIADVRYIIYNFTISCQEWAVGYLYMNEVIHVYKSLSFISSQINTCNYQLITSTFLHFYWENTAIHIVLSDSPGELFEPC